jgi:hypothetical protein
MPPEMCESAHPLVKIVIVELLSPVGSLSYGGGAAGGAVERPGDD